ncbi:hypothetical protein BO86DRAFT_394384 [Aspergillus japonicus CBS 114.51]|uniref:Uncharacterized protein n=1 Tax=Aspergillus japonicus CBS 114.51 TaxID=1448312 RepID=A0A8T8XJ38_ASPJA|nr:hypothetical protein BO86DRAFT_394384 [Aspergillus japonicus CBS 114.51]RAH87609.1 hypothetical protein BO86DRAFT_394384 [Aspergillus japonicus CBS 114.51]
MDSSFQLRECDTKVHTNHLRHKPPCDRAPHQFCCLRKFAVHNRKLESRLIRLIQRLKTGPSCLQELGQFCVARLDCIRQCQIPSAPANIRSKVQKKSCHGHHFGHGLSVYLCFPCWRPSTPPRQSSIVKCAIIDFPPEAMHTYSRFCSRPFLPVVEKVEIPTGLFDKKLDHGKISQAYSISQGSNPRLAAEKIWVRPGR